MSHHHFAQIYARCTCIVLLPLCIGMAQMLHQLTCITKNWMYTLYIYTYLNIVYHLYMQIPTTGYMHKSHRETYMYMYCTCIIIQDQVGRMAPFANANIDRRSGRKNGTICTCKHCPTCSWNQPQPSDNCEHTSQTYVWIVNQPCRVLALSQGQTSMKVSATPTCMASHVPSLGL